MPNVISNTLALIGGAAVGAAAMYLLDPDLGEDRRHDVADTASDAVSSTRRAARTTAAGASDSAHSVASTIGKYARHLADRVHGHVDDAADAVSDTASAASDSAHSVAGTIAKYARGLANRVTGHVSDATDSLSDAADDAASSVRSAHARTKARLGDAVDSARSYGRGVYKQARSTRDDWLDSASDLLDRAKARGRRALGVPEPHPVATAAGITAGAVGTLVAGAALMYFLDPQRGRARRALVRDKAYSITRQTGNEVRRYGHHLGNKAQGYASQVRRAVPGEWVERAKSVVSQGQQTSADAPLPETSMPSPRPYAG